jgi:hypothetical protein
MYTCGTDENCFSYYRCYKCGHVECLSEGYTGRVKSAAAIANNLEPAAVMCDCGGTASLLYTSGTAENRFASYMCYDCGRIENLQLDNAGCAETIEEVNREWKTSLLKARIA